MDRNFHPAFAVPDYLASLSARRAWIEIYVSTFSDNTSNVALRKESVDRNATIQLCRNVGVVSLSARRAWIEIAGQPAHGLPRMGRSPQGERG